MTIKDIMVMLGMVALLSCSWVVQGTTLDSLGDRRALHGDAAGPKCFNVVDFGAKPENPDNAPNFCDAWKAACASTEAAKVVVPAGTFVLGPVKFEGPCGCAKPIVFELQGTIKAVEDVSCYKEQQWIGFENIDGFLLTGTGTVDGSGAPVWEKRKKNKGGKLPPKALRFSRVNNSVIENIKSIDAMSFHITIIFSTNLTMQRLHITAPEDSPNTDGIHTSRCDLVNILDCVIETGDDCISMGDGTRDINIRNVMCGPGHGISIGSLGKYPDEQDVCGVRVTNCTLTKTDNGCRIKTWGSDKPSKASNIIYEDICMNDVQRPIIIDQFYNAKSKDSQSHVKVSDVHFKNIRGTTVTDVAVDLQCSSTCPCDAIELVDIDLTFVPNGTKKAEASCISSSCSNAKPSFVGKQNPPACLV